MPRLSRFILACCLLLSISGCVTTPHTSVPVTQQANEGAVIVRFLPNTQSASQFMKNWENIVVEQDSGKAGEPGQQYALKPDLTAASRSAVYVGALPPGRYRFVQFSSQSCGALCISERVTVNARFSRFEIRPQQLTDLGVIIQTPGMQGREVLLAHVDADDKPLVDELVRDLAPALAPMLDKPKLGWRADSVPAQMPLLVRYAKAASHGFVQPKEAAPGFFIFGTADGVVGGWNAAQKTNTRFDLGTHRSVEAVLVTQGGAWLAGGEFSLLVQSDDQGRSWHSIRGNLPLGLVTDIHEWHGEILVTMLRGDDVRVFAAETGSGKWRMLGQYKMDVNFFFDIPGVRPRSLLMEDQLVTLVPARKVAVLDLAMETAEQRDLPGAVQQLSASEDKVLRCKCSGGIAVNPWESRDMGKTWQPAALSRYIQQPAFRDRLHGVAFEGAVFSSAKLVRTADGGKTWIPSTDIAYPISSLFYRRDQAAVYAASPYGAVWESRNDGSSWRRIR